MLRIDLLSNQPRPSNPQMYQPAQECYPTIRPRPPIRPSALRSKPPLPQKSLVRRPTNIRKWRETPHESLDGRGGGSRLVGDERFFVAGGNQRRAIIISADSDHVPAVRRVRARLPAKQLFAATPPGRHGHAREMLKVCQSGTPITAGRIVKCLLPERIHDAAGKLIATRPPSYTPNSLKQAV
jgi:hypothetical protein